MDILYSDIYLIHGNLVIGHGTPTEDKSSWKAIIRENECITNEAVVIAINFKAGEGNEELFRHITDSIKRNYFDKIVKIKIPVHDLPLYIGWPWKTPEFMNLIKKGLK